MDCNVLTAIFITLTLNGIAAEYSSFKAALKNDLNATCVEEKGFNVTSATYASEECVQEALQDLYKRRGEINHNEERIRLMCTTDITKDCNEKFFDIVLPCLPEHAHEVVTKMTDVKHQGTLTLCANDAEHYKAMLETTCEKKAELSTKMTECELELPLDAELHLLTHFSTDNCKKYDAHYECIKKIDVECPDIQTAIHNVYHTLSAESPCAKHKTLKWMDIMT